MQIDRSALVRLAGFGGITAVALAANQLGLGEHSTSLLAGVAALVGEGARAVWGHLGLHLIDRVAGHSGGEKHARGAQNHDLHRLIGETIARILDREAEGAPGGRSGVNYLRRAAKAFQGNDWLTVELIGAEADVGEGKVPAYFKGDAESIKKAAVLEPAEWIALVEKVAGPGTFAEYEEQDGLALGGGRRALEYAANKLSEHFAVELWEAAKQAWETGDLAWPALVLRLLSLILGYASDAAMNSAATVGQLTELQTEVKTLRGALGGVAAEATAKLAADQIRAQNEMIQAISAYQDDLDKKLVRINVHILELQQEVRGGFKQIRTALRAFNDEHGPQLDEPFTSHLKHVDFTYRTRATHFVDRETAMNALLAFLGDPRPALWTVISGPAGSGKSRLAAELIQTAGVPGAPMGLWRGGFLRNGERWLSHDAVKWSRDANTLLVIDNAADLNRKALSDFLAHLDASPAVFPESPLRVILIDRLPPDSELGVAARLMRASDRRADVAANRWQQEGTDRLALSPISEESAIAIARDWARENWSPEAAQTVKQAVRADRELARPLFAFLIGDAVRSSGLSEGVLNPVTVSSTALARLFPPGEDMEFLEQVKILWAAATACQGVTEGDLFDKENIRALMEENLPVAALRSIRSGLRTVGGSAEGRIAPLEPNFLGGLFVLERLLALPAGRDLEYADSLMAFAWRYGEGPDRFINLLAENFVTRPEQVANAFASTEDRVKEIFLRLVLSGLRSQARKRKGPRLVFENAFAASDRQPGLTRQIMEAFEEAYSKEPEDLAGELASGYELFVYLRDYSPMAGEFAVRGLRRIEEIFRRHGTAEIARVYLGSLIVNGCRASDLESLAEHIAGVRKDRDDPELALVEAKALSLAGPKEDETKRENAADRIGDIRKEHDTPEIALEQAKALHSAITYKQGAAKRDSLLERISEIRKAHDTAQIALVEVEALSKVDGGEPDATKYEKLADRIGEIRKEHDTPEIALEQAKALTHASLWERDAAKKARLADRIGEIRKAHDTTEIARQRIMALAIASVARNDLENPRKWMIEIQSDLRAADIALALARALSLLTMVEQNPAGRGRLAGWIGDIRKDYNTPEIGDAEAKALKNATDVVLESSVRVILLERIVEILKDHNTSTIAFQFALAFGHALAATRDPLQSERVVALGRNFLALQQSRHH